MSSLIVQIDIIIPSNNSYVKAYCTFIYMSDSTHMRPQTNKSRKLIFRRKGIKIFLSCLRQSSRRELSRTAWRRLSTQSLALSGTHTAKGGCWFTFVNLNNVGSMVTATDEYPYYQAHSCTTMLLRLTPQQQVYEMYKPSSACNF